VLLELMDAVARLEASSARYATQMESLAKIENRLDKLERKAG
jgi:hypothetical protein